MIIDRYSKRFESNNAKFFNLYQNKLVHMNLDRLKNITMKSCYDVMKSDITFFN